MTDRPEVEAYVHGVCMPNPGAGGWGAVLLFADGQSRELSGGREQTTNNQMILAAASGALGALPAPTCVRLVSRSQYLCRGLPGMLSGPPMLVAAASAERTNDALWRELAAQAARHEVACEWAEGGGPSWLGRAEQLARAALPPPPLPLDDEEAIHLFVAGWIHEGMGAWAALLRHREHVKSLWGDEEGASVPRLTLRAALAGLRAVRKPLPVHLYTTSDYLHGGLTRWLAGWLANGWLTREGNPVRHRDLWEPFADVASEFSLRGHLVADRPWPGELAEVTRVAREGARGVLPRPALAGS
jgi:ribonuclease HI